MITNHPVILIHLGAGRYSKNSESEYQDLCKDVCDYGTKLMKNKIQAANAASYCTSLLEDSILTNAGYGSNITTNGKVQCDAASMDLKTNTFGAIGSIENVANPILLAESLRNYQQNKQLMYRFRPMVLVGNGALLWAKEHRIPTVENDDLKSVKSMKRFKKRNDTIGVICHDSFGNVSVCASSGGIPFKRSGRLGQVTHYGSGIWIASNESNIVASATTGCGEQLISTFLAKSMAEGICNDPAVSAKSFFDEFFINAKILQHEDCKVGGYIGLTKIMDDFFVSYSHTTQNMIVAHKFSQMETNVIFSTSLSNHGREQHGTNLVCISD
ncbi:hypothetical protein A3Q56_03543 [Intoshia linei]|uniref:Threonine aspartase 1 n=1 Tax=Intoshia linei TaxID=1819745 RepID=A0A177B345_9BILA|nr:hypothetical protein A3Q56_03543 [Intoshia linei]